MKSLYDNIQDVKAEDKYPSNPNSANFENDHVKQLDNSQIELALTTPNQKIVIPVGFDLYELANYFEPGYIQINGDDYNSAGADPSFSRSNYFRFIEGVQLEVFTAVTQDYVSTLHFYDSNFGSLGSSAEGGSGTSVATSPPGTYYCRISYVNSNIGTGNVNSKFTGLTNDMYATSYPSITTDSINLPPYVYTVCNDILYSQSASSLGYLHRNYCAELFIDRLFKIKNYDIHNVFLDSKKDIKKIFAPISGYQGTFNSLTDTGNDSEPKTETTIEIKTEGLFSNSGTVTQRSASSTNGILQKPRLLCIGDSITNKSGADYEAIDGGATVYWSWIKHLFNLDKIEAGDNSGEYELQTIGAQSSHAFDIMYDGVTKSQTEFAEGRSGWRTPTFLEEEWFNGQVDHYAGYNFFYDNVTYAADPNKFSLDSYLSNYRTLDDSGNRLLIGDPALGARIVDNATYIALSSADQKIYRNIDDNWNVNTPTHIVIQLGTNDVALTVAETKTNIAAMIQRIRDEGYTGIEIAISLPAESGTFSPSLYSRYSPENIKMDIEAHERNIDLNNELMTLDDDVNKVYYLPSSMVQPTAESTTVRWIDSPSSLIDGESKKRGEEFGNVAETHPNVRAHIAWAYQMYSWIKWTLG